MADQYGERTTDLGGFERAYLSRLHAAMFHNSFRGQFEGEESVKSLHSLLQSTKRGKEIATVFIKKHGEGNFSDKDRTGLPTVRLGPKRFYQLPGTLSGPLQGIGPSASFLNRKS